jgi:hypothetical protein
MCGVVELTVCPRLISSVVCIECEREDKGVAERLHSKAKDFEVVKQLKEEGVKASAEATFKNKEGSEVTDTQSADTKEKPKDRILMERYLWLLLLTLQHMERL